MKDINKRNDISMYTKSLWLGSSKKPNNLKSNISQHVANYNLNTNILSYELGTPTW